MIPVALALPMIAAALVGSALVWYTVRKRRIRHGSLMCLLSALIFAWIFFYVLELLLPSADSKRLMMNLQYFAIPYVAPVVFLFIFSLTGARLRGALVAALFAVPALSSMAHWTNTWHGLFYTFPGVTTFGSTGLINMRHNILFYVLVAYTALIALVGVVRLAFYFLRLNRFFREQLRLMLAAILLPVASNIAYVAFGLVFDFTPVMLVVSMYLYLWLLNGYAYCPELPHTRFRCAEETDAAFFQVSADNLILDMNAAACALLGKRSSELFMRDFTELFGVLGAKLEFRGSEEFRILRRDALAEDRYVAHSVGIGGSKLIEVFDIGSLKRDEERAGYFADFDALTLLPNKGLFFKHLQRELDHAKRFDDTLLLLIIDVDSFHEINELYGYQAGDRVLVELSKRMVESLRKIDTVSRFENDEFHVLLPKLSALDAPARVERLLAELSSPVRWAEHSIEFTLSAGMARAPQDSSAPDELLACARTALCGRPHMRRGSFRIYSRRLEDEAEEGAGEIRLMLERGEALCSFLPIDDRSGSAAYVQARVCRDLERPVETELFPGFAGDALMPDVELNMLHMLCAEHAKRFEGGPELLIELEHRHLFRPEFIARFCSSLRQFGFHQRGFLLLLQAAALSQRSDGVRESLELLGGAGAKLCLNGFEADLRTIRLALERNVRYARLRAGLVNGVDEASALMIEAAARLARAGGIELHAAGALSAARRDRLYSLGVELIGREVSER